MNRISLFAALAAAVLIGFSACKKVDNTPVPQQEDQIQAAEPAVKSVAKVLNEVAEEPEVQEAASKILWQISNGSDKHHITVSISAKKDDQEEETNYVTGEVGIVRGEQGQLEVDLNLMVMGFVPIEGTLDPVAIVTNFTRAILAEEALDCDYYLLQANAGLKLTVMGYMTMQFLRGEDEEGFRTVDLYLVDPEDEESEPVSLTELLSLLLQ